MAWLDFIKKYTLVKTQKQMPTPANKFILKVIIEWQNQIVFGTPQQQKEKKRLCSCPGVYVVVTCPDNSWKPEKALSGYLVRHLGTLSMYS